MYVRDWAELKNLSLPFPGTRRKYYYGPGWMARHSGATFPIILIADAANPLSLYFSLSYIVPQAKAPILCANKFDCVFGKCPLLKYLCISSAGAAPDCVQQNRSCALQI